MRGRIWSDLGHLGLPDLFAGTIMDASNSHDDGRADKPSDSRFGQFHFDGGDAATAQMLPHDRLGAMQVAQQQIVARPTLCEMP